MPICQLGGGLITCHCDIPLPIGEARASFGTALCPRPQAIVHIRQQHATREAGEDDSHFEEDATRERDAEGGAEKPPAESILSVTRLQGGDKRRNVAGGP